MIVKFNCGVTSLALALAATLGGCVTPGGGDEPADAGPDAQLDIPDPAELCALEGDAGAPELGTVTGPRESDAGKDAENLRAGVATALATNVVLPTLADQKVVLAELVCAAARYAADPQSIEAKEATMAKWRDAMAVVQRAELMLVGPAGNVVTAVGGLGIADEIYAWPLINRCEIDTVIAERRFEDVEALADEPPTVRGLYAMEYLLFPSELGTACGGGTGIPGLASRSAVYAESAALLAYAEAARLLELWEGQTFDHVTRPGEGGSPFTDPQQVLNAFSDALFYLYSETRDMKVAAPAGINADTGPVPALVESPYGDASLAAIRENILAFRAMFTGGDEGSENLGFDDLLRSLGAEGATLADEMETGIAAALSATDDVPEPLSVAVVESPAEVRALYDALKLLSDSLKSQFITLLDLKAPMGAAGDND